MGQYVLKRVTIAGRYALAISGDTGAAIRLCAMIYEAEAQKYKVEK